MTDTTYLSAHRSGEPEPRPRAAAPPRSLLAAQLLGSRAEQIDEVGGVMKRIGDDRSVHDGERGEESAADFGEQDGMRWCRGAVELRHACERVLVGGAAEPERDGGDGRTGALRSMSDRPGVAVGSRTLEFVDSCVRKSVM